MNAKTRDLRRYEGLREIGCLACLIDGLPMPCGPVEVHHLVDNGYRRLSGGNQATIPLGAYHHRGQPLIDKDIRYMRERFGPSMALERREFDKVYGSQRDLLARVNEMLRSGTGERNEKDI
jgi:hypothetical protein